MLIKIHKGYRATVALSDKNLLNQTFTEDIKEITLHKHFFEGEEINKEKAVSILKDLQKEDATFNIVGKKSVQAALEARIIQEAGIIKINEVPIALVLL